MPAAFWFMIAVVVAVSLSALAVMGWFDHRKKEREAHFRNETIRRITEAGDSSAALEFLREFQRAELLQMRSKARLAGLVAVGAGVGLMIFLYAFVAGAHVYLVGLIPVLVGVSLLIFTEFMMKSKN